jgi:hypothetical protein
VLSISIALFRFAVVTQNDSASGSSEIGQPEPNPWVGPGHPRLRYQVLRHVS